MAMLHGVSATRKSFHYIQTYIDLQLAEFKIKSEV